MPAYLFAFIPSLGAVILIATGQGLAHDYGVPGLLVLWGGAALPAFVAVLDASKLGRAG